MLDNIDGIKYGANELFSNYRGLLYGTPEIFIEASSRGFKPFSAFFARVNGKTIEEHYQGFKIINGNRMHDQHDDIKELLKHSKGKQADNQKEAVEFYSKLWDQYIDEHTALRDILLRVTGIGDIFGRPGSACQATELWRIRSELLKIDMTPAIGKEKIEKKDNQLNLF